MSKVWRIAQIGLLLALYFVAGYMAGAALKASGWF